MRPVTLILFGFAFLLSGPAAAELGAVRTKALVEKFIEHHAVPRFDRLHGASKRLESAVEGLCPAPDAGRLSEVRGVFKSAYMSWMAVQHIRFGPVLEDNIGYRIQFWPDKHGRGGRQVSALLAADDPVPGVEDFADMSVAVQGFPALERLLFRVEPGDFASDGGERRCGLSLAIARNIAHLSDRLAADWRAYKPEDHRAALEKMYRSYLEQFSIIAELKIRRPLGKSAEKARPKRAETWRTESSLLAIAANLGALGVVFSGHGNWPGLVSALDTDAQTQELAASLSQSFRHGSEVAYGADETLAGSVVSEQGRKFLTFLAMHVEELRDTSIELLAPALGISTGFNSLDGD